MYNSQDMETAYMFISRVDKEDVVPTCNGILAIKRNETELFVVRCMDLESAIQSEVSQKEKNQ